MCFQLQGTQWGHELHARAIPTSGSGISECGSRHCCGHMESRLSPALQLCGMWAGELGGNLVQVSHARAWAGTTVGEGFASSGRARAENPGLPLAFPCIPVDGGHLPLYLSAITLIGCVTNRLTLAFNSKHSFFLLPSLWVCIPTSDAPAISPRPHQCACYVLVLGVLFYSSYISECEAVPPVGFDLHFNLLMTSSEMGFCFLQLLLVGMGLAAAPRGPRDDCGLCAHFSFS